ncbi:MAG TPA: TetR/AcrR family transcriptional regulator [Acidimicrobiales bacterium]|jgi:AcrR family transcriptional regulator|nr:TetR/AcrR family transcriptional regulator [Acidimicrobiales bacterium]
MTATLQDVNPGVAVSSTVEGPFGPTEERILVAALALIGRRGVRRLGMREIAETTGVSRGTLYRYFPSKDHVVAAAAAYDGQRFSTGIDQVLAAARTPEERISSFMAYAFDFIRTHPCRPLFESEPGFVMSYLLDNLPSLRDELVTRLGDDLDTVPAVAAGVLGKEQLADVIVRLFASSWIIPEADDASLVQAVNRILQINSEETNE